MTAAFALALQVLLGGILATQAEAANLAPDSLFVICTSDGASPADHGPDKAAKHPSCVLCTFAKTAHALVPAFADGVRLDPRQLAAIVAPATERIVQYVSPTGQFQRGPPALAAG